MRAPKPKRHVYHVGDKIRVVIPKFVVRVGYPKQVKDYEDQAQALAGQHLDAAMRAAGVGAYSWDSKQWKRMVREIAYLIACNDGFGGRERSIHWEERPEYERATGTITSIRTAHTGTYNPPWSCQSYDGECDGDPGGLINEVRHRILSINYFQRDREVEQRVYNQRMLARLAGNDVELQPAKTTWGDWEIPVYHVEPVEEEK